MPTDKRKHFSQMTQVEIQRVMNAVRANSYTFRNHAMDRMRQKHVTENQIAAMLTYCQVIECHNNIGDEIRVLVRGKVQGNFVCVVVSLTTKEIVTTYWNAANDYHKTLDKSQYQWTADLTQIIH